MADLVFEVVEGPDAGLQQPLSGSVEIGREADLTVHDEMASRRHARLTCTDDGPVIEDLGSSNGTFVNGEEIHGPTRLTPGDHVLIGVSVIELRRAEELASRPTAVRPVPPALAMPAAAPSYLPEAVAAQAVSQPELDRLLDVRVKLQARVAPIGMLVLVALAIMLFIALR